MSKDPSLPVPPNCDVESPAVRALAAIIVTACVAAVAGGCGLCADDIVADVTSKDGTRRAWMNSRNCGATTAYANTLAVEVPEHWFRTEALFGELCIGSSEHVRLRWEGDDLMVTCLSGDCCPDRIRTRVEKVGRSRIVLEGFELPKRTP
jgi:hypothetical protein